MAGRGVSMMASLHAAGAATQPVVSRASNSNAVQQEDQNEPVDESALRNQWTEYTQTVPSEKILITAMNNSRVQLLEDTHVAVTVMSEEQQQRIEEHREEIIQYLRRQLHNSHLQISFAVSQGEGVKLAFTPRERMDEIQNENPELIQELLDTFGLELS